MMSLRPTRAGAIFLAAVFACLLPTLAHANWTASGRFVYVDREFDQTGFTGAEPQLPIRLADIEVLDTKNKVLATGVTNSTGNFSIAVNDASTRSVFVRVISRSLRTPGLFIDVASNSSGKINYYAVKTLTVTNHNPNTNVNFSTTVALKGQGGEAFNVYDQLLRGADYIAFLRGSWPGSGDNLSAVWAINRGVTDSTYERFARNIQLRDTAAYDDTAMLHEMGHFFLFEFSAGDSPDLPHTFSDCYLDIREAYEEGYATYWGNSVLRWLGLPRCNIYTRTNGGPPGPGSLVRYADLETDTQYFCQGDTSEVSVFSILWDINDSAATTDTTPGVDDAFDALSLPDSEVWQVARDYMPTAVNKSFEDYWDGWFSAPISNGFLSQMRAIAAAVTVDFSEDTSEVNNSAATAAPITVGAAPLAATFFYDQDGNGAGAADPDYFIFS
ncbi:MAG TPA: hypothetical protein VFG76_11695, partial [Candidatus Polarisedimenticolia bacterium]|nr:hypothetical protein [Candidatus Polarisedimenticolia bacterium]